MTKKPCLFCSFGSDGNDSAVFFVKDRYPVTPGHKLVIPRRHIESPFDMTEFEVKEAWFLIRHLRLALTLIDRSITGFNVGFNAGQSAGQTVTHAHVHVIPRRDGDTPNPQGGVRGVIPERMGYSDGS